MREFYLNFCSAIPLQDLNELFEGILTLTSAFTNPLNILGYIEVDIRFPGSSKPLLFFVTVVADNILNTSIPALIGSNILEACRHSIYRAESDDYPTSYSNSISIPSFAIIQKKLTVLIQSPKQNSSTTSTATPPHPEAIALTIISTNNNQQTQAERTEFLYLFDTSECSDKYKDQLKEVLWNNINSLAATHHELGRCEISKHDIELSDYAPIKQNYRRIPPPMFDAVKEKLKKLHEQGVVVLCLPTPLTLVCGGGGWV